MGDANHAILIKDGMALNAFAVQEHIKLITLVNNVMLIVSIMVKIVYVIQGGMEINLTVKNVMNHVQNVMDLILINA